MDDTAQSLEAFLNDPQWDAPLFKQLPKNDSGDAASNQGGPAIPKELLEYLPSIAQGTRERPLDCELFNGIEPIGNTIARYHYQDWGGTRTPEYRITRIQPLTALSKIGDFVVLQRRIGTADSYRITLLRKDSSWFKRFMPLVDGRTWGLVWPSSRPLSEKAIHVAHEELAAMAAAPFIVQQEDIVRYESRQVRIARTVAFKEEVRKQYNGTCAVSGISLRTPQGLMEVQAAHIVPLSSRGMDDVRNGLALCGTLHWAFDRGLFGIEPKKRTVWVPRVVMASSDNNYLSQFIGRSIIEANDERYKLHDDALAWHMDQLVKKWDELK